MSEDVKPFGFVPLSKTLPAWPEQLFGGSEILEEIGLRDFEIQQSDALLSVSGTLLWFQEISLKLPGLEDASFVFLSQDGFTAIPFEISVSSEFLLKLPKLDFALRWRSEILRPVRQIGDQWIEERDASGAIKAAELRFSGVGVECDLEGNIVILAAAGTAKGSLGAVLLGETGFVLELDGLGPYFSRQQPSPPGAPAGFRGLSIDSVKLHLPKDFSVPLAPETLIVTEMLIGTGGVSGTIEGSWTPVFDKGSATYSGTGAGQLFGIPFGLKSLSVKLRQNVPIGSSLKGEMVLPFFDEPVKVEISIGADGNLFVKLDASHGLFKLSKPNLLEIELDSIGFELKDGLFTAKLSGQLTPLFGGLDWPTFDVKELSIDSKGHVHLDGGWLNVREQKALDFYGFKIEISQLGFGTNDNGTRWIGFSGGLKLVDGLQAGASVEGLRITWNPAEQHSVPKITLNGAGVELTIPGVLHLKGEVSYNEITVGADTIRRFDGDIHLALETPEIEIDGTLVIGSVKGEQGRYNFFAIYVDVELPTGIPLASTGLGIYGFAGLFALQMEPDKHPDEMWFSIDHSKSFYHRNTPGITDLKNKWVPRKGSFAVGAGLTLATLSDNGYTFNGKFLLAIVIPGPIVLIQGAASFLKKRADGNSEGQFRALTVIDGRQGSILIGLDAEYKTGKGGEMIEIAGSMEAFYAFHDPTAWHLYLGRDEPRELRIRALFGRFVEANAYFMLDAHSLALGAWFGYKNGWKFGPLRVTLEAWAEGNARLGFKPTQFHGDLWLHALVELSAFGLGLGISLDAKIEADLFTPYHLKGTFSVGIKLPWPLKKKIKATVVLEWRHSPAQAPPLPLPVVGVAIEHSKSSVTWPLARGTFLLPSYDDGEGFLTTHGPDAEPAESEVPRVPLDARIAVTFGRSVHDEAKVGSNLQAVEPDYETIGDPAGGSVLKVRYSLKRVTLERKVNNVWQMVAASPASTSSSGPPPLWGQWAIVPQLPDAGAKPPKPGQTKLLLGAKTPFEFNRHTGSSWEEWVSDALPGYPCVPVQPGQEICFGFGGLLPQSSVSSPWTFPGPPAVTLSWGFGPATVGTRTVIVPGTDVSRLIPILCFPAAAVQHGILIHSEASGRQFRLILVPTGPQPIPIPFDPQPIQPGPGSGTRGTRDGSGSGSEVPGPREGNPPLLVPAPGVAAPTCVDVSALAAGTLSNPWLADEGARFTVRGADGALLPVARIERWGETELGLNAGFELEIEIPCPAARVTLRVTHRPPFRIVAFNAVGTAVATHAPAGTGGTSTETIQLDGPAITRIVVYAAGNEKLIHQVCFFCPQLPPGPRATGFGIDGAVYGPFFPFEGVISVGGHVIPDVVLTGDGPLCLEKVCVTPDPEAGQLVLQDERIQHQIGELARWQAVGEVLAPNSFYKLTLQTHLDLDPPNPDLDGLPVDRSPVEHAYFHTGGPPGLTQLSQPAGVTTSPFETGLEDLTRYVKETDPPTVPPPGEKPILFRPFYRAYDVGVELNENYVEQMYRMDRRDLGLYLYDNNNQPVRDARGRLAALTNRWGQAETLTLSEKETRWITLINTANCLSTNLDPRTFPHDNTLSSSEAGRVLAPDTLHEARLVPLLFHDAFTEGIPGFAPPGWHADDAGVGGPSQWRVMEEGEPPARYVEQVSGIGGAAEPERPGTVLLVADPPASGWTDVRISVYVRSAAGGVAGVVFRHGGPGRWYRFALHERSRRLVKAGPEGLEILARDHFTWQRNRDYLLTVEAIGKSLRTYMDGELVFAVEDGDLTAGGIGLYTCQSPGARFTDVRVDDFRAAAPAVFRFQFTTSLYANFFHHLHSFQDEMWKADLGMDAAVGDLLNEAVAPSFSPPTEKEARAYEDLATRALGTAARQNPAQVEVTRLNQAVAPVAFLVRSPEPLAWNRIEFALSGTLRHLPAPETPGAVKLVEATFGAVLPGEESATLLLREAVDLTRQRIELRSLPGVVAEPEDDPILLLEGFEGDPVATRARFTVVDQGTVDGPSDWRVEGGALIQVSEISGGAEPELPGTVALAGDPGWTDYRTTVDLRCDSGGTLGVVFHWVDGGNFYRLSLDDGLKYRRLVKSANGQISILWDEEKGYTAGETFRLTVEAVGSRLTGFLGDVRIFEVTDATHTAGQVGLYCAGNAAARFEAIEVRRPSLDAQALLRDRFAAGDLTGWSLIEDALGTQTASMEVSGGELLLTNFVQQGGGDPPGTYALAGSMEWADAVYSTRLRCRTGAALGLVFRGQDLSTYYRFSMSAQESYRRLVKRVNGKVTVLWQDDGAYDPDRPHEVTVVAVGPTLRGYLDGVPLFVVEDGDIPAGFIGLYSHDNTEARFSQVRVFSADRAFSGWRLDESFESLVADRWSFLDGQLQPLPDAWEVESGELRPAGDDPAGLRLALTGDPAAADYRVAVRLRPGVTGVVKIVLRFVDLDNYFFFSLDSGTGEQWWSRRVQGQEVALWHGLETVTPGREIGLTFDALGESFAGWLDGKELFRLEDAGLPAGRVGFFAEGSPDVRFTEVRVAEPEWTTWYGFGREDLRLAGTRIRISGGPEVGAVSSEAGVERRVAAPLGETGHLRFPTTGAELRIVGADGPRHRRTFLAPEEYFPLATPNVIRRADGTGFIFPSLGVPPLVKGCRLELTYLRERPGQVRAFSQAGDKGPEKVAIDIPWPAR